jgi:hypothetical protein
VPTNWNNLRPWKNSLNTAFEELCCQLARFETAPPGAKFTRKGTPDAGVECFWTLPTGGEWGWQAKFLFPPFGPAQWRQLDESVYTALRTHPNLTQYTICLPFDRPDARGSRGNKSFLDSWNERVRKWQNRARGTGRSLEFKYWGDSEIHTRLTKEEHAGRYKFWFDKEFLSPNWFATHMQEVIANAGDRYTPVLNVDLPISRVFEGLGRSPEFFGEITGLYRILRKAVRNLHIRRLREIAAQQVQRIEQSCTDLFALLDRMHSNDWAHLPFQDFAVPQIRAAHECIDFLRDLQTKQQETESQAHAASEKSTKPSGGRKFEDEITQLYQLLDSLREVNNFADSSSALLANRPALLLVGRPGSGKTHLLCDVAARRIKHGRPTVVLLGEQFGSAEPWKQILELLKLSCTREELLGALDSAALASGTRALIFIDAMNEGEGQKIWNKHLAGIVAHLENYPRIGIALSVRGTYEKAIIPELLKSQEKLIREEHRGFREHEYEAANRFFAYFGIEPSVPLLYPEFSTPQFLLLFCKSLKNKSLSRIPAGLHGITSIFNFYLDSINQKLARPECLDFDESEHLVQKATEQITTIMAQEETRGVSRERAKQAIDIFLPGREYDRSLFRHLLAEGLFAEDLLYSGDNTPPTHIIRFSYERFADHYVAKLMLDTHLTTKRPKDAFLPDRPLGSLFKDNRAYWMYQGLIEALCVQIPERIAQELPDLLPQSTSARHHIRAAMTESFLWRARTAFTDATTNYINNELLRYRDSAQQFWSVVITLAPIPAHPLNADALHRNLSNLSLADRDARWSTFIHTQYGTQSAIDRLLDWAWSPLREHQLDEDVAVLFATALAWLLTSSNRFLRDTATKSLVRLIGARINVLLLVLKRFKSVSDPYVIERLCAVAYGCAMKARGSTDLTDLALFFYRWIFESGKPYSHILIRDYSRGVIETAAALGVALDVDLSRIRPPYRSDWPKAIPSTEELETKYGWHKDKMPDTEWSRKAIYNSVMGFGDFARYVIGTNSGSFEWSGIRLGKRPHVSRQEKHDAFIAGLKGVQIRAWKKLQSIEWKVGIEQLTRRLDKDVGRAAKDRSNKNLLSELKNANRAFVATLTRSELARYKTDVLGYRANRHNRNEDFDLSIAQRWILQRVFDLGWTVEKFGAFDREANARMWRRDAAKAERIGKKYQWIAYHEFLGLVADNFEFGNSLFSDRVRTYEGPWQLYARDIDPSSTIRGITEARKEHSAWWSPVSSFPLQTNAPRKTWLASKADLPPAPPFLDVVNPENSSQWLVLETYPEWQELTPISQEGEDLPRRWLWYQLRSFLVERTKAHRMFQWLSKQHFWGRWMPENPDFKNVFLGEFYWAPAVNRHTGVIKATNATDSRGPKIPYSFILTSADYHARMNSFDCSVEDSFPIRMPGAWIIREMGLQGNRVEGEFVDSAGNLVAFDPAVSLSGPNALLIRKERLLTFLKEAKYEIMWFLLAGKQSLGGDFGAKEWLGELQISGAYRVVGDKILGGIRTKAIKPKTNRT